MLGMARALGANTRSSKYWIAGWPRLVAEWHPTKNGDLAPHEVSYGSTRYIWWKCPFGPDHEWRARAHARTILDTKCPFCACRRVSITNALSSRAAHVAAEWHPTKNGGLRPKDIVWRSTAYAWWRCRRDRTHVWRARILNRTRGGTGCPFCANTRVSHTNCLAKVAPGVAAQWHPTRNGRLRPTDVVAWSSRLVWWSCPVARDHVWRAPVIKRAAYGYGCPACAGRKVSRTNSLAALAPNVAAEWHPTRNGKLTPDRITSRSSAPRWWQCSGDTSHVWAASPLNRVGKGSGCPACARARRRPGRERRPHASR